MLLANLPDIPEDYVESLDNLINNYTDSRLVINNKTNNLYKIQSLALNTTNVNDGEIMVIYTSDNNIYTMELKEFLTKFGSNDEIECA